MDWDVVRFRSDADEPWRVTAIRVLPRVHPMMPQGLKIRVEWFRRWADVDETAVDPALFDELEHWIENRGFGDGEMG